MYVSALAPGASSSIERDSSRNACPSEMSLYLYCASSRPSMSAGSHWRSVSPFKGDRQSSSCNFSTGSSHRKIIFPNSHSSCALWLSEVCCHFVSIPFHLSIFLIRLSHVTPCKSCSSQFEYYSPKHVVCTWLSNGFFWSILSSAFPSAIDWLFMITWWTILYSASLLNGQNLFSLQSNFRSPHFCQQPMTQQSCTEFRHKLID